MVWSLHTRTLQERMNIHFTLLPRTQNKVGQGKDTTWKMFVNLGSRRRALLAIHLVAYSSATLALKRYRDLAFAKVACKYEME